MMSAVEEVTKAKGALLKLTKSPKSTSRGLSKAGGASASGTKQLAQGVSPLEGAVEGQVRGAKDGVGGWSRNMHACADCFDHGTYTWSTGVKYRLAYKMYALRSAWCLCPFCS